MMLRRDFETGFFFPERDEQTNGGRLLSLGKYEKNGKFIVRFLAWEGRGRDTNGQKYQNYQKKKKDTTKDLGSLGCPKFYSRTRELAGKLVSRESWLRELSDATE